MKKRLLPITLALILLMTFIPFGSAAVATGEWTATLMGQLDADVSDSVPEWGLGDLPEASVSFSLYEPVTIKMEFDEPIKFTGNWTGIGTDFPINGDGEAAVLGGQILNFIVDGEDLGSRPVPIIDRDSAGAVTLDIARQWGGDYDPYDLAGMDPFTSIEITFVVGHTAQLLGQLDDRVGDSVPEWGIGDEPGAKIPLVVGVPMTISMDFSAPIKFSGNWTGIATSIPVLSNEDAEATGAHITNFVVDGQDLGSKIVPLINRDDSGFMTIDIARQWGGSYDEYDLAGMDPFTSLEITFIVPNLATGEGAIEIGLPVLPTGGNAWIAGTFVWAGRTDDVEPDVCDWYEFRDQSIPFEMGVPFTVTLDLGSEKATHDLAHWDGFIMCVETDVDANAEWFEAFIDKIVLDGRELSFNAENVEVGKDRGIRVPLTSGWGDTPLGDHTAIGTFSKIEVTLVIGEYGLVENPFDAPPPPAHTPPPVVTPIERPDPTPEPDDRERRTSNEGLPGWVIPVIIGGVVVIAGVIVLVVIKSKKKEA